jgi:hypothetical protein
MAVVGQHGEQLLQIAQKSAKQYLGACSRTAHSPQNRLALRPSGFSSHFISANAAAYLYTVWNRLF